jgi:hypothetical protein
VVLREIDDAGDVSDVDEEEKGEHATDLKVVDAVNDDIELDGLDGLTLTRDDVNLGRFSVHKVRLTPLSNSLNTHMISR